MKLYERYGITDNFLDSVIRKHLNESQESKSIDAAKKLYMKRRNATREEARDFVSGLFNDIPFLRKQAGKFTLGVARMYLDGELGDAEIINRLNTTLSFVATDAHINEYDRDLNGLSAVELIDRFSGVISASVDADKEEIEKMDFSGKSRYRIYRIDSFEKSKEFYKYTYPESRWCITWSEGNYKKYTSEGMNQVYFCLRDDVDSVKPVPGENCPLDAYGLSMISVIVDSYGNLLYCTPRWNHSNGGNDSIMGIKEISQVVGVNFYKTFLPNNKWKEIVENALEQLKSGVSPDEVFSVYCQQYGGLAPVKLKGKWNILKGDGFLCDRWYDNMTVSNGNYILHYNNKKNILDVKTGKPLLRKWFDYIKNVKDGHAEVSLNRKWNILDIGSEEVLLKDWYNEITDVRSDTALVRIETKWNIIDIKTGRMLLENGVDEIKYMTEDRIIRLKDNHLYNVAMPSGKLMFKEWAGFIDFIGDFIVYEYSTEERRKYILFNKDGSRFSDKEFSYLREYICGLIAIKYKGKMNLITGDGEVVIDEWVDSVLEVNKDLTLLLNEEPPKFNFVFKTGKKMFDDWQPIDIENLEKSGYIPFEYNGRKYRLSKDCEVSRDD